jgi:hypothetical protein
MIGRILSDDQEEHELLAIGTYTYMKMKVGSSDAPILDIRGGELPGLVLRPKHCGFKAMTQMVTSTLSNWRESGVCAELALEELESASRASA